MSPNQAELRASVCHQASVTSLSRLRPEAARLLGLSLTSYLATGSSTLSALARLASKARNRRSLHPCLPGRPFRQSVFHVRTRPITGSRLESWPWLRLQVLLVLSFSATRRSIKRLALHDKAVSARHRARSLCETQGKKTTLRFSKIVRGAGRLARCWI